MFDYYKKPFTPEEINRMINAGLAIRADDGGLVLGPSHNDGGIKFLVKMGDKYLLEGELEGYEYILNLGATFDSGDFFSILNNHAEHSTLNFEEYEPALDIMILDCRDIPKPKYLVFEQGGFGIVNKFSTKGYLASLNQINRNINYKIQPDGTFRVAYKSDEPVHLYFYGRYGGTVRKKWIYPTMNAPTDTEPKKRFWRRFWK